MDKIKCKDCNDTYYVKIESCRSNRLPLMLRCSCDGSRKNSLVGFLNEHKQYIQTSLQDGIVTMKDIVKILTPE